MSAKLLPLAVSLGDPAGIGPELIAEAWARHAAHGLPPFFVCGGATVLAEAAAARGIAVTTRLIDNPAQALDVFAEALPVLGREDEDYRPGEPDGDGAALALHSLQHAANLAAQSEAAGVVTAPIAKANLAKIGFDYPGQTEFLADVAGMAATDAVMMLSGPQLRTVPLTVHVALSRVPELISENLIVERAKIMAEALKRDFDIANPRIAVAGLNPHAGEGTRFGDEESRIIAPAITRLRESGIDATGPHPADALFTARARPTYDAALCMYHDQALIPLKTLDFDEGVNVTLGLPFVRTSPDHGTAFSIAGKRIADPGATIAALRMAGEMAARRANV